MTIKLELKNIAPYLPYDLEIVEGGTNQKGNPITVIMNCDSLQKVLNNWYTPILRPLSDLTKEIEVNGERFVPMEKIRYDDENDWFGEDEGDLDEVSITEKNLTSMSVGVKNLYIFIPHGIIEKLFEWHFDVFNLIENNLAIDINSLTTK